MTSAPGSLSGVWTQEFILQPTSFCNINCDYCYLPGRQALRRMSRETLARIFQTIFAADLPGEQVRIVWHAGEPLTLPISFYEEAWRLCEQYNTRAMPVAFVFQTNGTLITQRWCDFIKAHQIDLSISLDGPQQIHDAHRVDRAGRGTFARIMRNIDLLHENGIYPGVLMVLTRETLAYPEEIWQFLLTRKIRSVSFLPEEALLQYPQATLSSRGKKQGQEDNEQPSTLKAGEEPGATVASENVSYSIPLDTLEDQIRYRDFLKRVLELREKSRYPLQIRELDQLSEQALYGRYPLRSQACTPLAIISFDCDGRMSTLSPELLTLSHPRYPSFHFGTAGEQRLEDIISHPAFRAINAEVQRGVARCKETCDYFFFCGGGSPVNKLSETGSFASTETVHCRLKIKTATEVVIEHLQHSANGLQQ
jgi:uncharacterized protein